MDYPDYAVLAAELEGNEAGLEPAECHGGITAAISSGRQPPVDQIFSLVLGKQPDPIARDMLVELIDATAGQLNDPGFSYRLFLPVDSSSREDKLHALVGWGVLYLAVLNRLVPDHITALEGEAAEFIEDLKEIVQMDPESGNLEGADAALVEIIEYVRVGAVLVAESLFESAQT